MLPSLRLKKNEERRIKQGHVWVFSNEVDIQATPLKDFTAGQQVIIEAYNGKPLGIAAANAGAEADSSELALDGVDI